MSDYKPSFVFQSKLTSQNQTVNTETPIVTAQADSGNTMGSASFGQAIITGALGQWETFTKTITSVLTGGLATGKDVLNSPDFQCSLILLANELSCGGAPSCPNPKAILALKTGVDPKTGKPKTDLLHPDKKLHNRPILGLINIWGFSFDGNESWENGHIYDPKNGKEYKSIITMKDKNTLNVRGYIGITLMGRNDVWTRSKL